ncbi:hypothetical protein B1C81_06615 [Streptomyces sp. HG99]|nr:hypothetical protein B1C81_06615 [Streptomyces sp. HG99]
MPPHDGNGAHGAYEPQEPPNVYHPQAAPAPAYDEYADPAAAHGWENAYDETRELPPVAADASGAGGAGGAGGESGAGGAGGEPGEGRGAGWAGADARRHGSGGRSRRKPSPWRSRRVVVAAGAAGAVSAAALIAGFAFSGSPSGAQDKDDRTGSTAGESGAPAESDGASASDTARTGGPSGSGESSDSASAAPSPSASGSASAGTKPKDRSSGSPTAGATTTSDPVPATSSPSQVRDKPGHGPGGTKGPR